MPIFEVTSPDGKKYQVDAPEGATQQQAIEYVASQIIPNQQPSQQKIPTDKISEPEESSGFFRRAIGDTLVSGAQGVLGLKEAGVGLLDIPTMGYAGKGIEAAEEALFGGTTADLKEKLQEYKSQELQAAEQKVAEAEGFVGTGKELLKNPSALVSTVVESLPSMYGGGKIAQYALKKAAAYNAAKGLKYTPSGKDFAIAAGAGEGIIAAGASAESIRQATESGTLSPSQAALATLSGGLTGVFGAFGADIARKLNLVDVDVLLAGGATQATKVGILRNAIGGALSEGLFEELPQSFQEQILQNVALGKDPMEGVAEAAATGFLAGAAMGGGASLLTQATRNRQAALEENTQNASTEEEIKQQKIETEITEEDASSDDILGAVEQQVKAQEVIDESIPTQPISETEYTPTGDSITLLGQPVRISAEGIGGTGPYGAGLAGAPINVGQFTTGKRSKPVALNQSVQTEKINKSKNDIEETDADEALNYQVESERRGSVYTNLSQSNPNFQNLHPFVITGGINAAHSPLEYTSIDKSTKVKEGKFKRLGVNEIPISTSIKTVDSPQQAIINAIDQAAYEDAILNTDTFDTAGYNKELDALKAEEEQSLEEEYKGLLDEGYTPEEIRKNNPDTFGLRQQRGKRVTYYTRNQFEKVLGQEANAIRQKYENKKQPKLSDAEIDNKEIRDDFIKNLNDLQREMYSRRIRQYRQDIESIKPIKQPPGGKQEEVDYVFKRTPIENTGYERVPVMRRKGKSLVPLVKLRINQETGDVREIPVTTIQKVVKEKGERIQKTPVIKSEITETKEPSKAYIGPDLSVVYDQRATQEITNLIANELAAGPVSLNRILDVIANRKGEFKDYAFERMADHLSKFIQSTNNNVQIQAGTIQSGNQGQFDPVNNIITIDLNKMGPINPGQVVVHETMHAALDHIIDNPNQLNEEQTDGIKQLELLREQTIKSLPAFKKRIGDLNEFVAEVYSNQELQRAMGETKSTVGGRVVDLIQRFVEALTKALGFVTSRDTFRGSLLQETALEIESLLRGKGYIAPIKEFRGVKTRFVTKAPEADTRTVEQAFEEAKDKVGTNEFKKRGPLDAINKSLSRKQQTARYLKTKFQNARQPLKSLEEQLRLSGKLIIGEEGFNNINSLFEVALGEADFRYKQYLAENINNLKMAIHNYAQAANLEISDALDRAHKYLQAIHEQERRLVKYVKNVPLNSQDKVINYKGDMITPARFREIIIEKLTTDENITPEMARKYRKKLDEIVEKYKNGTPGMTESPRDFSGPEALDPNSDLYDVMVVDPKSSSQAKSAKDFRDLLARDPFEKEIRAIGYMLKPIQNATQVLNKEGNYLPKVAENIINFYGWENYIPLKGRPGQTKEDEDLDLTGERLGGDFRQIENPFGGRESESNNALIQTMIDAVTSSARAGRRDITQAISNLVKQMPSIGRIVETVPFSQKYNNKIKDDLLQGKNQIVNYKPNGDLEIIKIEDEELLRAIRRTYEDAHWATEVLNNVTSFIGQTHTRYNPAFPLLNFVRDTLTNAFVLGAEKPSTLFRYTGNIAQQVAGGGMFKTNKMIRMFINNNIEGAREYAKKQGKGSFAADMFDYLEQGGAVSYIQALSIGTQLDTLYKEGLGPKKILLTKKDIDAFFDKWVNTFEISARVAAYRAVKADNLAKGMSEKAAVLDATQYAKGLANFEQVGEWGRGMGAWFMFFRPSATGAVRALDAITPALQSIPGLGGMEEAINSLPKDIRENPEAVEEFKRNYKKRRTSAMITVAVSMGIGYMAYAMSYMMSGDDDEERNKVATDDPERWTRFARFDIGEDKVLQIPWGFGLGGFAAIGAQMAALSMSEYSDPKNILGNMANITLDSFLPLPVSRMNVAENTGMYMIDSITPSALRPVIEYQMNMNSFGYAIYNNRQTRYGNAYTGGDNIPQMYKDTSEFLNEISDGELDMSPNVLYFFANNYFDGWLRMLHSLRETDLAISGRGPRDLDSLTRATMVLDSFVAKRSNVDAREFANAEKEIKNKERKLTQAQISGTDRYFDYLDKNPMDPLIINSYKAIKSKELDKLRAQKNEIRRDPSYTPAEKKEQLEDLAFKENAIKRKIMYMYNSYIDEETEY